MHDVRPRSIDLPPKAIAAILLLLALAHFVQAYLKLQLHDRGIAAAHAYNLTYFVVPLVTLPPLVFILRNQLGAISRILDPRALDLRLITTAIVLGILLRIAFWSQLIARVSFGIGTDKSAGATLGTGDRLRLPAVPGAGSRFADDGGAGASDRGIRTPGCPAIRFCAPGSSQVDSAVGSDLRGISPAVEYSVCAVRRCNPRDTFLAGTIALARDHCACDLQWAVATRLDLHEHCLAARR